MTGRFWVGGLILVLAVATAVARPGAVRTTDGQTYRGEIDESNSQQVTIVSHGVQSVLPRSSIATITYDVNLDDEFNTRMGKLGATDVPGRIEVAHWAFDAGRYDLARQAVDQALTINPNDSGALTFQSTIQQQLRIGRPRTDTPPVNIAPAPTPPVSPESVPGEHAAHPMLTAADIQSIRIKELRPDDDSARFRFDNDVRRRFVLATRDDVSRFMALKPIDQAMAMIADGDTRFISDVKILSDPYGLLLYRQRVQPVILTGCATSGCHGGENAGRFFLFGTADSEQAAYTNFYILQSFSRDLPSTSGFGGGGVVRRSMIDRTNPSQSLLLQYGLPAGTATYSHPPIPGYHGIFRTPDDPRYGLVIDWISQALTPVQPDYGIHYAGGSATQPSAATRPAATTAPSSPAAAPRSTPPPRGPAGPSGSPARGAVVPPRSN